MKSSKLRALGVALGMVTLASATGSAMAQETVTRTDWQMHAGQDKSVLGEGLNKDALGGDLEPWFGHASVPAANDAGWTAAPNRETIAFRAASVLTTAECKKAVDHTYFQTFVTVPETVEVSQFDLSLNGMDDIARISIYNAAHTDGSVVAGSYVRRGQPSLVTADLKDLLVKGENRVVITLLDNCGGANNLDEAKVELNGAEVPAVTPPPAPPPTGPMLTISHGDVHIKTHDGLRYDFQTPGDFLLMSNADGTFQLQERNIPYPNTPGTSVTEAAAAMVDGNRIEVYFPDRALYINGAPMDVSAAYDRGETISHALPGGAMLTVQKLGALVRYQINRYGPEHPFSSTFHAMRIHHHQVATSHAVLGNNNPADPWVLGLTGIADGNRKNDLTARNGELLLLPAPQAEIERIGATWRVTPEESLFLARPATVVPEAAPAVELAALPVEVRTEAAIACATGGVTDLNLLRDCTYDVAATGDKTFAVAAADMQADLIENPDPRVVVAATGLTPVEEIGHEALQAALVAAATVPAPEPAVSEPTPEPIAPAEPAVGTALAGVLPRGERMAMNGHYIIFQDDGNLCVYREADDGFVWCINNDPAIRFQDTVQVGVTAQGQLEARDAAGEILYALPAQPSEGLVDVFITESGELQVITVDGGILWRSN